MQTDVCRGNESLFRVKTCSTHSRRQHYSMSDENVDVAMTAISQQETVVPTLRAQGEDNPRRH